MSRPARDPMHTRASRRVGGAPERLEPRVHFTAVPASVESSADLRAFTTPPPPNVYVRGTAWTAPFMADLERRSLGAQGLGYAVSVFGVPAPADNPGQVLSWIGLDQIVVQYPGQPSGGSVPTPGTFTLTSGKGVHYTVTTVSALPTDPRSYVATLDQPLGGGNPVTGRPPTVDENGDRITLTVHGGGVAGTDLVVPLTVAQGDVDHDGRILAADYSATRNRFFKDTASPSAGDGTDYSPFHDVTGSGQINAYDYSEVKKRFFQFLPPAPTTAATAVIPPVVHRSRPADRDPLAGLMG